MDLKDDKTTKSNRSCALLVRPATSAAWATAAALGAALAPNADAGIVFVDQTITLTNTGDTWFLDSLNSTTPFADLKFQAFPPNQIYNEAYSVGLFPNSGFNSFRFADQGIESVRKLGSVNFVSGGAFTGTDDGRVVSFNSGNSGDSVLRDWNQFDFGTEAFAGFRFDAGSGVRYGWVKVTILPYLDGVTLNTWAYEDSGNPIQVGAIPEPSTEMLGLAALAAGIVGMRRYKRKAA